MAESPSAQTTLAILLGASEWPGSPQFNPSPAFATAADSIRNYLVETLGISRQSLLDLFDLDESADDIDLRIGRFLSERASESAASANPVRDLLVYFIGHGGFVGASADYYLAIRRTRTENPTVSAIALTSLAYTLKEKARHLRRILVLDCCFAGAAYHSFQSDPSDVAIQQAVGAFEVTTRRTGTPSKGTSLLCSSGQKAPSMLMPDESSTMFSRAMLNALTFGDPNAGPQLSIREIASLAADFLRDLKDAPRPEVHSPDQSEGDVAELGMFPNPSARDVGSKSSPAEPFASYATPDEGSFAADFAARELAIGRRRSVNDTALPRSQRYFPSPQDWGSEVLYYILLDRFSDGREEERPLLPRGRRAERSSGWDGVRWAESGRRWQGGTLGGARSKLDYLQKLGITTL